MSRFRLLPTAEQEQALLAHCRDARYVWNLAVEQQQHWQPGRKAPGYLEQAAQLTEARDEYAWLRAGSHTVRQQALRDFAQAMRNFFAGTHRRPTWRKAGVHEGFRPVAVKPHRIEQLNRRFAQVWVPKVGWVRFSRSRPVPAGVKSYRVTRDRAGRWHVAFAHVPDPVCGPGDCSVVGIDRGVVVSAALSTGELLHAPGLTPGESKRLTVLQQRLARATRGSRRREETKRAVAKLKARERDRRRDWVEKTTTDLARRFDVIRVEDLDVRAMPRSACGHVAPGNRKSQAVFECEACTAGRCNADVNAARNIAAGRAVTARGDLAGGRSANREPQLSAPSAYVGGMRVGIPGLQSGEDVKYAPR
ncbi:transposase [Mycobacterium sp.]|jgi:putative transposase|uniref:RNA-guided endonuclease InsQ/TnpB family protein n=1 Tax=Mycobacterium sp. TaxID=1785 RepID=UPI0033415F85|nr:transposase [Mycobacterium sp.]